MSYNLTPEELHEMRDWSSKAEQLVRLGMLPVAQLPYIKRALKAVQADAFLPLLLRKPFYKFIEEVMELALGEPGIYRLIRNKVAANRNDSVISRYMPEETIMDETQELNELSDGLKQRYARRAQGERTFLSKAIKWHKSADRPRALKNKKIDAKIIAKHEKVIAKREKGIANATAVKEETLEEAKTSFKKLLRPNFYKDEKAKANVTQTAKIADDAHSKAEVTEDCKKLVRPNPYKDEKAKANVTLTAKIADAAHSKAKVTEERDADERAGDREDREFKRKVAAYDRAAVDKAIASSRQKIGKKEGSAIHRLLKGRHEKVNEEAVVEGLFDSIRAKDIKLADIGKKKAEIPKPVPGRVKMGTRDGKTPRYTMQQDGTLRKEEFEIQEGKGKPRHTTDAEYWHWSRVLRHNPEVRKEMQKELGGEIQAQRDKKRNTENNMPVKVRGAKEELELINLNLLDEDVNYRSTPQGMLQTMSNIVKIKKRHGGKVNVNDRKLASKARNELRRRKYFTANNSGINAEFDTAYLDLADVLAEEGIFLDEQQLDELKQITMLRAYGDRMDKARHHRSLAASTARMLLHPNKDAGVRKNRALDREHTKKADRTLWHMANKSVKEETIAEISDETKQRYAEKVEKNFKEKGVVARGRKQFDKVMKRLKTASKILAKEEVEPLDETSRAKLGAYEAKARKDRDERSGAQDVAVKRLRKANRNKTMSDYISGKGEDYTADEKDNMRRLDNRKRGVNKAHRIFREKPVTEETLKEVSDGLKARYIKAAEKEQGNAAYTWKYSRNGDAKDEAEHTMYKRDKGIAAARKKKVAEAVESVNEVLDTKPKQKSYLKAALNSKSDADFSLGMHSDKKNENQHYRVVTDKGNSMASVNQLLRTTEKRSKGINTAINKMAKEGFTDDYPESDEPYKTATKPPKKVRPSKSTWYKSADDAGDVKNVDPKMKVRFNKEEFEQRFAKTLELFEVSHISELDAEMTKMFMSLVQSESKSDEDYQEKVYDKIRAAKKEGKPTPEQIRYRAEKEARAAKTQATLDAAKKELSSTKVGTGWSKAHSDSE